MKKLLKAVLFSALFCFAMAGTGFAQTSKSAVVLKDTAAKKEKAEYTIRLAYYDAGTWPAMSQNPLPEHAFALAHVRKPILQLNVGFRADLGGIRFRPVIRVGKHVVRQRLGIKPAGLDEHDIWRNGVILSRKLPSVARGDRHRGFLFLRPKPNGPSVLLS